MQPHLRLRDLSLQFHRRHLPHFQSVGGIYFVTFRLKGSLPACWRERVEGPEPDGEDEREARLRQAIARFRETERIVDAADRGPTWLRDPAVASMVCGSLHHGDGQLYRLHRYVVMPNHVHVMLEPVPVGDDDRGLPSLAVIMQRIKGFTARRANSLLGRTGAFWQDEYFDHGVRNDEWYRHFLHYIDENPVLAGLCETAASWPWGSAGEEVK